MIVPLIGSGCQVAVGRGLKKKPGIETALEALIVAETGGDPTNGQKWVRRSLRRLSRALSQHGYSVSRMTIRRLLKKWGYSLKANRKQLTGPSHPDRDCQFRHIEQMKACFFATGHPVISVDAKKKELIGNFKNPGRIWCRQADKVNVHDFRQDAIGRAVPYGIYDLTHNLGYVYVGTSAETSEFAVDAIRMWWEDEGRPTFPDESQLLILSDAGGSDGCRFRLWKQQLQEQLADRLGIEVMVCHYPTGTSKWNPIEHRLFSHISLNWAGRPLDSWETMLGYIRNTTTETGLKVKAFLVDKEYKKGLKVSEEEMAALNLVRHSICPKWNYALKPHCASP